jgi:hypothetical protein
MKSTPPDSRRHVQDDGDTTPPSRKRQFTIDDLVGTSSRTLFTPGVTILIPIATALCTKSPPSCWFSPSWSDWQLGIPSNGLRSIFQLVRESRSLRLSLWYAGTVLAACEYGSDGRRFDHSSSLNILSLALYSRLSYAYEQNVKPFYYPEPLKWQEQIIVVTGGNIGMTRKSTYD